jgi:hypothetical protein
MAAVTITVVFLADHHHLFAHQYLLAAVVLTPAQDLQVVDSVQVADQDLRVVDSARAAAQDLRTEDSVQVAAQDLR